MLNQCQLAVFDKTNWQVRLVFHKILRLVFHKILPFFIEHNFHNFTNSMANRFGKDYTLDSFLMYANRAAGHQPGYQASDQHEASDQPGVQVKPEELTTNLCYNQAGKKMRRMVETTVSTKKSRTIEREFSPPAIITTYYTPDADPSVSYGLKLEPAAVSADTKKSAAPSKKLCFTKDSPEQVKPSAQPDEKKLAGVKDVSGIDENDLSNLFDAIKNDESEFGDAVTAAVEKQANESEAEDVVFLGVGDKTEKTEMTEKPEKTNRTDRTAGRTDRTDVNWCTRCGNKKKRCHDELFGGMLIHDVMTMYYKMENGGRSMDVTKMGIWDKFEESYQSYLRFYCYQKYKHYDLKNDYKLPTCVVANSLSTANELVKYKQTVHTFDSIRMYGAAARFLGNVNYTDEGEEVSSNDYDEEEE